MVVQGQVFQIVNGGPVVEDLLNGWTVVGHANTVMYLGSQPFDFFEVINGIEKSNLLVSHLANEGTPGQPREHPSIIPFALRTLSLGTWTRTAMQSHLNPLTTSASR